MNAAAKSSIVTKNVRSYIGTLNNPDLNTKEFLSDFHNLSKAVYTCGQLEIGENGTPHIQFAVHFKNARSIKSIKSLCPRAHFEAVTRDNGIDAYCMKEETRAEGPFEFGTRPTNVSTQQKIDWEKTRKMAEEGKWKEVPAEHYIKYFGNLKKIHHEAAQPYEHNECRGHWLWGPPGTGKTTFARSEFGEDIYIKSQNKWWDGYIGQKVVILDDLDSDCLSHYLKIWADKWPCTGEIKGASVNLCHTHFVVTSNYSIEELFGNKGQTLVEAVRRRFKVTHFNRALNA